MISMTKITMIDSLKIKCAEPPCPSLSEVRTAGPYAVVSVIVVVNDLIRIILLAAP